MHYFTSLYFTPLTICGIFVAIELAILPAACAIVETGKVASANDEV